MSFRESQDPDSRARIRGGITRTVSPADAKSMPAWIRAASPEPSGLTTQVRGSGDGLQPTAARRRDRTPRHPRRGNRPTGGARPTWDRRRGIGGEVAVRPAWLAMHPPSHRPGCRRRRSRRASRAATAAIDGRPVVLKARIERSSVQEELPSTRTAQPSRPSSCAEGASRHQGVRSALLESAPRLPGGVAEHDAVPDRRRRAAAVDRPPKRA